MPVTTTTAAIHLAPVVVKTFVRHARRKVAKKRQGITAQDSRDDMLYDQAFHIVKEFIQLGTENTIESLQAFTNTHVPSPYGAAVSPVIIPLSSCNEAADTLIDWFGPDELKHVIGGERWWQVRGLDGVDGEWVTEKDYLLKSQSVKFNGRKLSNGEKNILRMEHLETVMYYIHGGGYFWGSINTHRYQVIRYAREMRGRVFTVNYRKAPQYPWPCALQDVLAGYLYLIQPPPEALHKAIPSSKIIFAGDSAGGGLSLAVLSVLRDLSLPLPGGAVLISPWVDLTHSFPSILKNTKTDIIPPYGFLAKPSTLWPIDLVSKAGTQSAPSKSNVLQRPGHPGIRKATTSRTTATMDNIDIIPSGIKMDSQRNRLEDRPIQEARRAAQNGDGRFMDEEFDIWQPRPPEVLMNNLEDVPLVLRSQIQLYATTEQLTHPLVSPILQGSLGNLPPLYILAGNEEVLRDEVIYLAHRAANPARYPVRNGILRESRRQLENARKFTTPTKVHLQVYDGMCHVLTIFTFTDSAKFAYRSIADFAKHIVLSDKEHLQRNPFPDPRAKERASTWWKLKEKHSAEPEAAASEFLDPITYERGERMPAHEISTQSQELFVRSQSLGESIGQDLPEITIIRERVDISGSSRAMEPEEEVEALQLRPFQIGVIKEDPAKRWLEGQEEWDKRYARRARKVLKHRWRLEQRALRLIENAHNRGLVINGEAPMRDDRRASSTIGDNSPRIRVTRQKERRWGPLDLDNEQPPPSAIAKRRDTPEALALLKKSIYDTALVTRGTMPTLTTSDAVRAAFSRECDPRKRQHQSASEEQVKTHLVPVHGLQMWNNIIRFFGRKTS